MRLLNPVFHHTQNSHTRNKYFSPYRLSVKNSKKPQKKGTFSVADRQHSTCALLSKANISKVVQL